MNSKRQIPVPWRMWLHYTIENTPTDADVERYNSQTKKRIQQSAEYAVRDAKLELKEKVARESTNPLEYVVTSSPLQKAQE